MFLKNQKFLGLLCAGMLLYSCQKEKEVFEESIQQSLPSEEGMIKLGRQLENPYSVENMKKALQNLKKSSLTAKNSENVEITATHLYIRFIPKTDEELSIIKTDSTLVLYDYPLDYEIIQSGDYYREPNLPENQPTPQYCAVKFGQNLPNGIEYEVLSELFIPDEEKIDNNGQVSRPIVSPDFAYLLVGESLRLTDNEEPELTANPTERPSKWRPSGYIRTWDDNFGRFVGVRGLKVQARRWFTTHTGFVDDNGFFQCDGQFRRPANYKACFERYDFEIRDGWLSTAYLDGPKTKGSWNVDMRGDKYEFYATIFRAAHHYYYEDIKGLRRPPQNGFWKTQLKIKAVTRRNGNTGGDYHHLAGFLG